MFSELIAQIRTTEDKELLLFEIGKLKETFYQTKGSLAEILAQSVRASTASSMESILASSPDKLGTLEKLEKEIESVGEIGITMAFEPTNKNIDTFYSWVVKNIGPGHVLAIKVDASLIGGAIITFNGKYVDATIKKFIESAASSVAAGKAQSATHERLQVLPG